MWSTLALLQITGESYVCVENTTKKPAIKPKHDLQPLWQQEH